MSFSGASTFTADRPRIYKAANIQFDAVYNKVGYHFPQARILALWEDAWPVITKQRPPEPLVMRMNTFDCVQYQHTNLIPAIYEMDDYQVRTPTDVIGQHIHLPKWDLTAPTARPTAGTTKTASFPGSVQERIHAIRQFNQCEGTDPRDGTAACPKAKAAPVLRPLRPGRLGRRAHGDATLVRRSGGEHQTSTVAWAPSSPTTTSAHRPTSRLACTPPCWPNRPVPPGTTPKPASSCTAARARTAGRRRGRR
jgi:hypothetical protein